MSIFVFKNVLSALSGLSTIGWPFTLNDVFSNTGTLVIL